MNKIKKLFGEINLTWKKVILFALIAGVFTAAMALIPTLEYTSFHTIVVSFEVWILFGIFIIMNAKSNIDAALKCFVFFLISQPLVYLLQVPFSSLGWQIFQYYKPWAIWTVACLPMGFMGYYIKKGKWWGYLILLPMIVLTAFSLKTYLKDFTFCHPFYLLVCLFCAAAMILYPIILLPNKKMKAIGAAVSGAIVIGILIFVLLNPYRYSTEILNEVDHKAITMEYQVSLEDNKYGEVYLDDSTGTCVVQANFKKRGKTKLIVVTPEGETREYNLRIEIGTYEIQ
ncbi:MAG: hypothetical protein MJ086_05820 [Lachnospiraceae bacterium]|nr:hypothetical protein [Lachnospiraceae bacterium]